jgi:hypothetical protein
MSQLTELEEAKQDLAIWKKALRAIATTGQSYQIGQRRLERSDLDECRKMVAFYQGEVARLSAGRGSGARVIRVVPRDL